MGSLPYNAGVHMESVEEPRSLNALPLNALVAVVIYASTGPRPATKAVCKGWRAVLHELSNGRFAAYLESSSRIS